MPNHVVAAHKKRLPLVAGKYQCLKAKRGECKTPCYHADPHWRGTHCSRDRRDTCPTCTKVQDTREIRIIKGIVYAENKT